MAKMWLADRSRVFLFLVVVMALGASSVSAGFFLRTCSAAASGSWTNPATWTGCGGGIPTSTDNVDITGYSVSIGSDHSAFVYSINLENYARLTNDGHLRAYFFDSSSSDFSSSGPFGLTATDGNGTGLVASSSSISLSHSLTISGDSASILLQSTKLTISGSLTVDSVDDGNYASIVMVEYCRVSVTGDVTVTAGSAVEDDKKREATKTIGKRGFYSEPSGLVMTNSIFTVGGSMTLSSRDNSYAFESDEADAVTSPVGVTFYGSVLNVAGDLVVQTGDSQFSATGDAMLSSGEDPFDWMDADWEDIIDVPESTLVVGGSVTVQAGSITGVRTDDGFYHGSVVVMVLRGSIHVNGSSSSSLTVTLGKGGDTSAGNFASNAELAEISCGFGGHIEVNGAFTVKGGRGGKNTATEDEQQAGAGDSIVFGLLNGGSIRAGGDLQLLAGNGGNATGPQGSPGGGGTVQVYVFQAGTIDVGGNFILQSGNGGHGYYSSYAEAPTLYLGLASLIDDDGGGGGGDKRLPSAWQKLREARARATERGDPYGEFDNLGLVGLTVGGDLKFLSGSPSPSSADDDDGYSCGNDFYVPLVDTYGSGLLALNSYDTDISVGGDLVITGCNGGNSLGGTDGGNGGNTMLVVSGGVHLDIAGSLSVASGNGGNVVGGNGYGGDAGSLTILALIDSTITIGGSAKGTSGHGGSVTNGQGSGGNSYGVQFEVLSKSSFIIDNGNGPLTLISGNGGSVNAGKTLNAAGYAGVTAGVQVWIGEVSTFIVSDLTLDCGSYGNAVTNTTSDRRRSDVALKRDVPTHPSIREMMEKRGYDQYTNLAEIYTFSSATVYGALKIVGGSGGTTNFNAPYGASPSIISVYDRSTLVVNGGGSVSGSNAGTTTAAVSVDDYHGGQAGLDVEDSSVLDVKGDMTLRGGNGLQTASTSGWFGGAFIDIEEWSTFNQAGYLTMEQGHGTYKAEEFLEFGVYLWAASYNIFSCDGAGLSMAGLNTTFFFMDSFSSFKDCSGSSRDYPTPYRYDASSSVCAPCSCSGSLASCPDIFGEDPGAAASAPHDGALSLQMARAVADIFSF